MVLSGTLIESPKDDTLLPTRSDTLTRLRRLRAGRLTRPNAHEFFPQVNLAFHKRVILSGTLIESPKDDTLLPTRSDTLTRLRRLRAGRLTRPNAHEFFPQVNLAFHKRVILSGTLIESPKDDTLLPTRSNTLARLRRLRDINRARLAALTRRAFDKTKRPRNLIKPAVNDPAMSQQWKENRLSVASCRGLGWFMERKSTFCSVVQGFGVVYGKKINFL